MSGNVLWYFKQLKGFLLFLPCVYMLKSVFICVIGILFGQLV